MKQFLFFLFLYCLAQDAVAQKKNVEPPKTGTIKNEIPVGKISQPVQVYFCAKIISERDAMGGPGETTIKRFETIEYNQGNSFDGANGIFTAPVSGYYNFILNVNLRNYGCYNSPVAFGVYIVKNGREEIQSYYLPVDYGKAGITTQGITFVVRLGNNETISLRPSAPGCSLGGSIPRINKLTFCGYKLQ